MAAGAVYHERSQAIERKYLRIRKVECGSRNAEVGMRKSECGSRKKGIEYREQMIECGSWKTEGGKKEQKTELGIRIDMGYSLLYAVILFRITFNL